MKRLRNWLRRRRRRRRWRQEANRSAELTREFVYLDEVSVFSLLASKDGMIAQEVTDTHASTLMAEASGSLTATGGVIGASTTTKAQASDTRTTQVLRKAIIQSTFRDLYIRVRDSLAIVPAPEADTQPPVVSVADLQPDGSRAWILDPTDLRRGDLVELTVELEAEPLFQARTVVSTFLEIFEKDHALFGIEDIAGLAEAAAISRMIEKLGAGLVPLRAKAKDYRVVALPDGRELIAHREMVERAGLSTTTPLFLVGVAEETLFWKDIRSVVFAELEFQVLARVLRPGLQRTWTPLKLVEVLGRVSSDIRGAFDLVNSTVLDAMVQGATVPAEASDEVRAALSDYADLLADSLDVELDPHDAELKALLQPPPGLEHGSSVKQWRSAMDPITDHVASVAGAEVDRQAAARLRVLAQMKRGLSPIDPPSTSGTPTKPGIAEIDERLIDTEIIAIYW